MPTEAEITAARIAILDMPVNESTRDLARAALTAAEEVRGQAVPDEAAIRADERERCAKVVEDSAPLTSGPDYDAASDRMRHLRQEANIRARDLAAAIRAAAPKPEDKP